MNGTKLNKTALRIVVASAILAAGAICAGLLTVEHATAAPLSAPPVTRQQAVNAARNQPGIVRRLDRIDSKLVTWHDIQVARNATGDFVARLSADQQLWVVVTAGDYVPQLARGAHYTWGASVFDANTGEQLATYAGIDAWPIWFVTLKDRAGP